MLDCRGQRKKQQRNDCGKNRGHAGSGWIARTLGQCCVIYFTSSFADTCSILKQSSWYTFQDITMEELLHSKGHLDWTMLTLEMINFLFNIIIMSEIYTEEYSQYSVSGIKYSTRYMKLALYVNYITWPFRRCRCWSRKPRLSQWGLRGHIATVSARIYITLASLICFPGSIPVIQKLHGASASGVYCIVQNVYHEEWTK